MRWLPGISFLARGTRVTEGEPRGNDAELGLQGQHLNTPLEARRRCYDRGRLEEAEMEGDPISQLQRWLDDASELDPLEPTAMALATCDEHDAPDARMVLLRYLDQRGLTFFGGLASAKGRQMAARPAAAATLFWPVLERQVRIRGSVEELSRPEVQQYFSTRPRGSQLGAWASPQSQVIQGGRAALDRMFEEVRERFGEGPGAGPVPLPADWGGWRLIPATMEFWQGRPNRLHDRLRYRLEGPNWRLQRLAP